MESEVNQTTPVEPPRGMCPGRLDDKGRLKLPAAFHQYLASLPEPKLFVTSLDRRIAQIYPISSWRQNEKFFESFRDNPAATKNIFFNASDLGSDETADAQGRVTVNKMLRDALGLAGQELHLYWFKGRVEILTEAIYQERLQKASRQAAEDLDVLERAGLL